MKTPSSKDLSPNQDVNAELLEALKRLTGMIRDFHNVYNNHSASVMMRKQGFKLAEAAIAKAEKQIRRSA